ncbi:IMPACT isoform X2 [Pelobates cultripes]|uniref:IMPACT isoform X2 n=1 Tax=Pelobates cultripes TaxID=61616 RepID=A0AAD1S4T6_PELCU|nr:IMPACT isoform X2 [Pelobates cultripes]
MGTEESVRVGTLCKVILPPEYPISAPPLYQLNAPWLRGQDRTILSDSLEELYLQNIGENILYLWVEKVREFLVEKSQTSDAADQGTSLKSTTEENYVDDDHEILLGAELSYGLFQNSIVSGYMNDSEATKEDIPTVEHGEPISDRRSTFQAHLAHVVSPLQVKAVLNKLYENKKIAAATHNIYAYRIHSKKTNTFIQDCEDDGETAAGKRLLHLMQILDARDVMVVVSRWYGGILLGPDRFKHINNCARNILVEHNYTNTMEESAKHTGKNKHTAKENKKRPDK